jgi:hypothetical protein
MGVLLSLTLDWMPQQAYLIKKTKAYQKLIRHKRLTTSNRITIANMVTTAYASYSMGIVSYPNHWLQALQSITLITLKKAMCLPANVDDEPFFMAKQEGGRGLVNLVDLNKAITCALTYRELNGHSLSHLSTAATWDLARPTHGNIGAWIEALRGQGLTPWPKIKDINFLGHASCSPLLLKALAKRNISKWSQLTNNGVVTSRHRMEGLLGCPIPLDEYALIRQAVKTQYLEPVNAGASSVINIEMPLAEMQKFTLSTEELIDYHYHYPTNTLTLFTDGSCTKHSSSGGVYYHKTSPHN